MKIVTMKIIGKMTSKIRGITQNNLIYDNIQMVTEEEYALLEQQTKQFLERIIFKEEVVRHEEDTL